MQKELFYLQIAHDYPYNPTSAVLRRKVRAEDGHTYAAKGKTNPNDYTPVNEWICASIAEKIGIPVPEFRILKNFDNALLFGSRWAAGIKPHAEFYKQVEDPSIYSSIFAFDLLVLNEDRHWGNYLLQEVDGNTKLLAFDHSHSLLHHNSLPAPNKVIFFPPMKTVLQILPNLGLKIDKEKFDKTLIRFKNIEQNFFDVILSECIHTKWMDEEKALQFSGWLKQRHTCVDNISNQFERWNYEPVSILSGVFGA